MARARAITLYTSPTLLAELAEVIVRDKFAHRVLAAGLSPAELVQDYERMVEVVEPEPLSDPICRDPDDDHVLACAMVADADLIVSRDKDLLELHEYQGIPVLVCADALQRLDAAK
jgi:putative PIN family toxin of toxin-antitoxin system